MTTVFVFRGNAVKSKNLVPEISVKAALFFLYTALNKGKMRKVHVYNLDTYVKLKNI